MRRACMVTDCNYLLEDRPRYPTKSVSDQAFDNYK